MVLFNYATKEITAKIVYYGPGLCGKTTNLQFVYDSLPSNNRSKMLSLATKTDRTLFFDFLPLDLGKIRGMRTKLQLYTVPGQVYYNSTRQLVLKGADGVVFVADSQDFAVDANLESLQNLEDNLKRQGIRMREMPLVMQYNKRDLPNALSPTDLDREVNKIGVPRFESVATTGIGVEETLKGITQLVLAHLIRKYGLEGSEPLDREIQILNAPSADRAPADSLWDDDDDVAATVTSATPAVAAAPVAVAQAAPAVAPAAAMTAPFGESEFELDDVASDDAIPLVATELVGGSVSVMEAPFQQASPMLAPSAADTRSPFEDLDRDPAAAGDPRLAAGARRADGLSRTCGGSSTRGSAGAAVSGRTGEGNHHPAESLDG
jgi:signal recognition particle receptor subunit beta